ncbi:MAG: DsrE family protein [Methanobacteriaceae archaeon]|nr:DsrE family protein [Methanobacteriaceae archaeon]
MFHLDTDEDYNANLNFNNIDNLLVDLGRENVEIELVTYALGVNVLRKNSIYSGRIEKLIKIGVNFAACKNTTRAMNIQKKDLIDGVEIVSSGVGELVRKQALGWLYIRP